MKYLKEYNSYSNISYKFCDKSKESYEFISKYLDVIDYDSYISNDNLYQICGHENDELISISIFKLLDGKAHINYSAVKDEYRNKGISKEMRNKIIDFLKKNNCKLVTSNVKKSNINSIKSLLSTGFKINDRVKRFYPDGEEKIAMYLNI
jgi:ribosomal protein S18 acetylase RimI-like enzyme